ncbi:LacI family DNA-binding transcriptional regulator [Actinomadura yumaensis]|uniref:LacI family DNA-binding transcriptional regulator n=1 Tax=Actinomadura yumaensis TaxID=111807 RepID=A0ABW2CLU1_9ACTN
MSHPTLEDVAARAGVSRALVSLVMRGSPKVGKERREAVLEAARELGYRPNVMARSLAAGRTGMVGLLADLHDPACAALHDGMAEAAARRSVRLLLVGGGGRPARERAALHQLLDLRPDGVLLANPRSSASDIERAAGTCPLAVVGRSPRSARLDGVTGDDAAAVELAVSHLAALGHRDIACLSLSPRPPASLRNAYAAAMRDAGLGDRPIARDLLAPPAPEDGGRAGAWRPSEPFSAAVAIGDATGAGALAALGRTGLRVPGDVSLVVVGDPPGAAAIGVTTVAPPPRELGRAAMELLLDRIGGERPEEGRRITVPPLVVGRPSTAPPA